MQPATPIFETEAQADNESRSIAANPILKDVRFQTLVRKRRTFSWTLTGLMLVIYFAFILTLAFDPALLGHPIVEGSPTTWGIPVGFGMFAATFLLVAIYVFQANRVYDLIVSELKQGAM